MVTLARLEDSAAHAASGHRRRRRVLDPAHSRSIQPQPAQASWRIFIVSAATEYQPHNIIRFRRNSNMVAISDKSAAARGRAEKAMHGVYVTPDANEVITSPDIDAVAIVTPVWTHFELAKAALENGKHVFVEKPFTSNTAQAEELINLAARKNLQIMVDHTFLFTGAVRKIKQL